MDKDRRAGLTLIEIVIVVGLIVILTGVYFLVANPAGQLAQSRNNRRTVDLQTIMLAIKQNIADQGNETFGCPSGSVPTTTKVMGTAAGDYNIAPCIIPTYIAALPFDPISSTAYYSSVTSYNTGYAIMENASGSITLSAPSAELGQTITVTE